MKSRLPDVPVLKVLPGSVAAPIYNRVLRTLSRLGDPQELVLGDRGLHFRLERELWLCTDLRVNNAPLIAWSRFERRGRVGLHTPVRCQVLYYHAYGTVIELAVLNDIDRRLATGLAGEGAGSRGARVVPFRRPPQER